VLGLLSPEDVYEAFRRFLAARLRPVDEDAVHVSEVCRCLRASFFSRMYGSRDLTHLTPAKRVVLGLGLSTHLVLEEVLRGIGYVTERQVAADVDAFRLVGTPDAVGRDHVVEIKTVSSVPERPYPHHVLQLNAYLGMLGCGTGYLVYISKKDGLVKVLPHPYRDFLFRDLQSRAAKLYSHLRSGEVPQAEPTPLCNYCEWRWRCVGGGEVGSGY